MSWLKLDLDVAAADAEAVGDLLLALGAVSVSVSASSADAVVEPAPGATPLWRRNRLSALLPLDADVAAVRNSLAEHVPDARFEVGFVGEDEKLEGWREYAVERCFGGRLWVLPRDARARSGPTLRLDPGLAFGTGRHPTTRLCLEWLASRDLGGARLLDFGCGSGILALAACALGAGEVVAVDHDPQALLATRENAAYNHVTSEQLIVQEPTEIAVGGGFDVIVANILANPLLELAAEFVALLRPGASLVLSGILADQTDQVVDGYPGIRFDAPVQDGDWLRLSGVKHDASAT
ncbi:MAG: 50S ribosomal protein L11 methyltransferase [Pseudomonadales bacterium]